MGFTFALTLPLNFQDVICHISAKNGPIATNQKANISAELSTSNVTIWICDHRVLAMTLIMNFQGQMWNLLYLRQRWFDYHKIKSKHK